MATTRELKVTSLFAGVGGIEKGLESSGFFKTHLFCESDPAAAAVLQSRFPDVPIAPDVRDITELPPDTDILTAGFPCQDLSSVGTTQGLSGAKSSLVKHVFRLLADRPAPLVLIENVPFMLNLNRGMAMRYVVRSLESLGYRWAYRVLDAQAFGLPQRRKRVYLIASQVSDPAEFLFAEACESEKHPTRKRIAYGFYWTEGNRGLGWAEDSIPTLKGGSGLGIPSPPAIWLPSGEVVTPDIRDAERLQGLPANWTLPAESVAPMSARWRLVGNAVPPPVIAWIAELMLNDSNRPVLRSEPLSEEEPWSQSQFGYPGARRAVDATPWPTPRRPPELQEFLRYEPVPLSARATRGFAGRLAKSSLRYPPEFMSALTEHLTRMSTQSAHTS